MTGDLQRTARAFAEVLPAGAVSAAEADRLAASVDLWPRHLLRMQAGEASAMPLAVLWPESVADLQQVVLVARREGVPLVAYGAGSSVVGGATPDARQVVVDFKRMARLVEIDAEGRFATAEVGIMGELFERQLSRRGFTQGHFPSSIYCSTLGGWIAARSAGQMSSRYGKIEDQLVGGKVVLGDGSLLVQSPTPIRDPLFDTVIGAEGTLGLWAEATVRIHPLPAHRAWRGFTFPDVERAVAASRDWLEAGLTLSVVRVYDPLDTFLHHLAHAEQAPHDRGPSRLAALGARFPRLTSWLGEKLSGGCRCIVGLQGTSRVVDLQLGDLLSIAERHSAKDLGPGPGEAWYARRYAVSYGQSRAFRAGVLPDTMEVACPWDRILPTYWAVRRAAHDSGAQVMAHFSHVYLEGGSIYFTYVLPMSLGTQGYDALWKNTLRAALKAGANVSHHHGTGRLKAGALAETMGGGGVLLERLRGKIDPDRILNPALLAGPTPAAMAEERRVKWRALTAPGVVRAHPDDRLGEIEGRLSEEGRTLGPVAALRPGTTVLEAARERSLLHTNSQLHVIEPLVSGVDALVGGRAHWFVPAPRAAMGPDLTSELLGSEVDGIWLRTSPILPLRVRLEGQSDWALRAVRCAARDEACHEARFALVGRGNDCTVEIWLPGGERGEETRRILGERFGRAALPGGTQEYDALQPIEGALLLVGGSWRRISTFVRSAADAGLGYVLPWVDAVGAAGYVFSCSGPLDDEALGRIAAHALELEVTGGVAQALAAPRAPVPDRMPRLDTPGGAVHANLELAGYDGALDNCTYCPKLCRFACPVAVADGSESLTPRQLMLSVGLHRRGLRQLSADVASRIWACADCRGCRSFCDHGNDVAAALIDARAALWTAGVAPPSVRAALAVFARDGRLPDVEPPDALVGQLGAAGRGARTVLFLGCQMPRDDLLPSRAALALTERRFGAVRLLDADVTCCGHPLWRWGDREQFAAHALRVASHAAGADRIVTADAGCAFALGSLYRDAGIDLPPVFTLSSLLEEEHWRLESTERWALHDDCYATRWLGGPSMRGSLALAAADLAKGSVLEGESGCCGGMLIGAYDSRLAERVAKAAVHDLLGGGATRILTNSQSCRRRLLAAGAPVDDLVTLWFGDTQHHCTTPERKGN